MKFLILLLFGFPVLAQNSVNTEIFVFDITEVEQDLTFENGKNISLNEDYDNQPSFYSGDTIIYSKSRKASGTDIAGLSLNNSENFWISNTKVGGEYSPQRIPGTNDVAAVRLDTTGLQRLYRYDWETKESSILVPDLKVGYFAFLNEDKLLFAVLTDTLMDLVIYDLTNVTGKIIDTRVGRSIQKVPGIKSMSYTAINEQNQLDLYILDLDEEEPKKYYLTTLPEGVNDYSWLDKNRILAGKGSELLLYDVLGVSEWTSIADLSEYKLQNITRVAVNKDATKLALAAELLPQVD